MCCTNLTKCICRIKQLKEKQFRGKKLEANQVLNLCLRARQLQFLNAYSQTKAAARAAVHLQCWSL